jgi:hypothetical protein
MNQMGETCQSNNMTSGLNNFMTLMNDEGSHAITEKMWRSREMQYKITDEYSLNH